MALSSFRAPGEHHVTVPGELAAVSIISTCPSIQLLTVSHDAAGAAWFVACLDGGDPAPMIRRTPGAVR